MGKVYTSINHVIIAMWRGPQIDIKTSFNHVFTTDFASIIYVGSLTVKI